MVARQRHFARTGAGAVLDGRDIGTVVLPDATAKLFVTADPETRARRRAEEIRSRGGEASDAAILADLSRRDRRDAERATAPLRAADDAYLLDTTGMDIETAFRAAVDIVERARAERD
jgi:cytidylate kinase